MRPYLVNYRIDFRRNCRDNLVDDHTSAFDRHIGRKDICGDRTDKWTVHNQVRPIGRYNRHVNRTIDAGRCIRRIRNESARWPFDKRRIHSRPHPRHANIRWNDYSGWRPANSDRRCTTGHRPTSDTVRHELHVLSLKVEREKNKEWVKH